MCGIRTFPDYFTGCLKHGCLQYMWKVGAWDDSPCLNSCVAINQKRTVKCFDEFGQVYEDEFCDKASKPPSWKLCQRPKLCTDVPRSCREIKLKFPDANDGEYELSTNFNWKYNIYCADMNSDSPEEYLTLTKPNYAKSSKHISQKENSTCMFNEGDGTTNIVDTKLNDNLFSQTNYNKIRIILSDLSINILDSRFSYTKGEVYVPFGTAKDCSGSTNCPNGHFRIDLRGTGFSVSSETKWNERYHKYGYRIIRTHRSQLVKGWCGGQCTGCSPINKLYIVPQIYGQDYEEISKEIS
uniref:GON domain protein n=1 Tax=Dugesia japonica TaxID=6161 RepID=B2ZPN2_DUGJA|nr:GON domain protein [Dugesia japonica]